MKKIVGPSVFIIFIITAFFSGILFSHAASSIINSAEVTYTNGNSVISVQEKIDKLYSKINNTEVEVEGGPGSVYFSEYYRQPSYNTATIDLTSSYDVPSEGIYVVNVICGVSGYYSLSAVSLGGASNITEIDTNTAVGNMLINDAGCSGKSYTYRVVADGTETLTGTCSYTLKSGAPNNNKSTVSLQLIKIG